ncbi:MAG: UDP-2,3-diacylglucosamine diphosphatase [Bacteroidia bacterium]|nr:UDP-2,3-diacylglucosamine diphosphatase [Bacteroidia bacterium]
MKKHKKRKIDLLVISDVHLGTFGCRAKELLNYLKTLNPKILILNGDFIDIWQFNKRYFPKSHMKVIKYITSLLASGTRVYYITGNHDEMLRKFKGFQLGNFEIVNKVVLELDGKKAWFFHGDVFDVSMKHSKWLARLGGMGYDLLIMINTLANRISELFGKGRISLSKKIKNSVKSAVKFIDDFEETAAEIAISNGYDFVVCGHIHQAQMREVVNKQGESVIYLNSGDWIENLTALEYHAGEWSIYEYAQDQDAQNMSPADSSKEMELQKAGYKNKELFEELIAEFQVNAQNKTEIENNLTIQL